MRRKRQFLPSETYFVTIRTVEQRFALEPLGSPGAWLNAGERVVDLNTRLAMRGAGQFCITATKTLAEMIHLSEQKPEQPRFEVTDTAFTDSIPNIVGSCLARGVDLFGVHIYAFVWMSNHVHLLMRAPNGNFAAFMAYLNGQVAVNVNRFLGRKHALWSRRYTAAQVLDDDAVLERLGYILANPQNAGRVAAIDDWPGFSSASFLLENHEQRFLRFDRTAWHKHERPSNIAPFLSTVTMKHTMLPQLASLDTVSRVLKIRQLIQDQRKTDMVGDSPAIEDSVKEARRKLIIRAAIPTDRPVVFRKESKRSAQQPLCHTTSGVLRKLYKAWYRDFRSEYEKCSRAYRQGNINVQFPPGSFAPTNYPTARSGSIDEVRTTLAPTAANLALAAMRLSLAT